MKLYYSPGACSLADHIALHEAGLAFEHERVDIRTKRTEHGADYREINPKGYVPALRLDSGDVITENVALLDWISDQSATLRPSGPFGRTRQLELLAYLSSEVHKAFGPLFRGGSDEDKAKAREQVSAKLQFLSDNAKGEYLLGDQPGVGDFYLLVMLLWAGKQGIDVPARLSELRDRLMARESVQTALRHEGLS
jgi:glutathione S-transferase